MRGTHGLHGAESGLPGIIPADAGNTRSIGHEQRSDEDHPRGCGEHESRTSVSGSGAGSSPRMRGTLTLPTTQQPRPRIIPADAGNTNMAGTYTAEAEDHPRGCGEHMAMRLARCGLRGSSPRMRGTQRPTAPMLTQTRIIPADAGNTDVPTEHARCAQDHSRGCGEHRQLGRQQREQHGSSPRMRGTRRGC